MRSGRDELRIGAIPSLEGIGGTIPSIDFGGRKAISALDEEVAEELMGEENNPE